MMNAEVESILKEACRGEDPNRDIRWREAIAHVPPRPYSAAGDVGRANVALSRHRVASLHEENIAAHTAAHQATLDDAWMRSMYYSKHRLQDQDIGGPLTGVQLGPASPPRGAVNNVAPGALHSRQGTGKSCGDELHWHRVAIEESSYLRQRESEARDLRLSAMRDCGRAQEHAMLAALESRDQHLKYAEQAAITMRNAWLVKPPPLHFERQLTQSLVDHGEKWWETCYGKMA